MSLDITTVKREQYLTDRQTEDRQSTVKAFCSINSGLRESHVTAVHASDGKNDHICEKSLFFLFFFLLSLCE